MTVKDVVITLFFIGSILLAGIGGWNYMKGRVVLYQEKVKVDKMIASHNITYDPTEQLEKIRKEKTNALIMFAVGFTGFFSTIIYIHRRRNNIIYPNYKTRQS